MNKTPNDRRPALLGVPATPSGANRRIGASSIAAVLDFLKEPSHAENLAVFRIVLSAVALGYFANPEFRRVVHLFASLPASLVFPPYYYARLLKSLPIEARLVDAAYLVFVGSTALTMVGLATRASATLATISGVYALGVPQLFGKVDHYHHILWFLALMAASPSGDALSIDALIRARRDPGSRPRSPSVAYGMPLKFVILLLSLIYFFPGFWKLTLSGRDWALGDSLVQIMHAKWHELGGWTPGFRIDRYPWLCRFLGASTIAFELGFPIAALSRRWRPLALASGIAFHTSIFYFMNINFLILEACYVAFVDWHALARRLRGARPSGSKTEAPTSEGWAIPKGTLVVGLVLLALNLDAGIRNRPMGWPFACYPTFAGPGRRGREFKVDRLEIEVVDRDGATRRLDSAAFREAFTPHRWAALQGNLLSREKDTARSRAMDLGRSLIEFGLIPAGVDSVRMIKASLVVDEGDGSERVLTEETLAEFPG